MSNKLTGLVSATTTRNGTSKKGPWTIYTIKIGDDWFSGYADKVPTASQVEEGDTVAIEWEANGNYKNYNSLDIIAKGTKVTVAGNSVPESQANREWHISLGAGINQAATIVGNMVAAGVITLPKTQNKQYDTYMGYVKEVAVDLAKFNFFSEVPSQDEDDDDDPMAAVAAEVSGEGYSE